MQPVGFWQKLLAKCIYVVQLYFNIITNINKTTVNKIAEK